MEQPLKKSFQLPTVLIEFKSQQTGSSCYSHLIKLYGDHLNIDLPCKLGLVAIIEYCTNQGNPPITITKLFDDLHQ